LGPRKPGGARTTTKSQFLLSRVHWDAGRAERVRWKNNRTYTQGKQKQIRRSRSLTWCQVGAKQVRGGNAHAHSADCVLVSSNVREKKNLESKADRVGKKRCGKIKKHPLLRGRQKTPKGKGVSERGPGTNRVKIKPQPMPEGWLTLANKNLGDCGLSNKKRTRSRKTRRQDDIREIHSLHTGKENPRLGEAIVCWGKNNLIKKFLTTYKSSLWPKKVKGGGSFLAIGEGKNGKE